MTCERAHFTEDLFQRQRDGDFFIILFFYPHYRCAVAFQMGWLARAQVWHWPLLHLPPSGAVAGCSMTSEVAPVCRRG